MSLEPDYRKVRLPDGTTITVNCPERGQLREIGRIARVDLGPEDHGLFSFAVHLRFQGSAQAYGPYALDEYQADLKRRVGSAAGLGVIMRFFAWAGVTDLSRATQLPVIAERGAGNGDIVRLWRLPCDGGEVFDIGAIFADYGIGPGPRS